MTRLNNHSERLVFIDIIAYPVIQCSEFVSKVDQAHDMDKNPDKPRDKAF
jgi:hypothetical protein